MIKLVSCILIALTFSFGSYAQEFGAAIGAHQTTADSNDSQSSVDGKLNFKVGGLVAFELVERGKFRSGFIYSQRHVDVVSSGQSYEYKFDYFDFPANFQYNLNEMVGVFGGLTIAVNINDSVDAPSGIQVDADAENMIALLNLGVNLTFSDMIGFDFYYERGMGRFADKMENFSTFGGNFLYWF